MKPTILVVDDDEATRVMIQSRLRREGFDSTGVEAGAAALGWLSDHQADLMLLDLELPDMRGDGVVKALEREGKEIPFIVVTGQGNERVAVDMMKQGARDYLTKGGDLLDLLPSAVRRTLDELEQTARQREAELDAALARAALDQVEEATFAVDLETGRLVEVNGTACRWLGYSRRQLLALCVEDIAAVVPLRSPERGPVVAELKDLEGDLSTDLWTLRREDGSSFPVDVAMSSESFEGRNYLLVIAQGGAEPGRDERSRAAVAKKALILDDFRSRQRLIPALQSAGFEVMEANGGASGWPGLKYIRNSGHDLLILAEEMTRDAGMSRLPGLRNATSGPIFVVGPGGEEAVAEALIQGADAYFPRKMQLETLIAYIRTVSRRYATGPG